MILDREQICRKSHFRWPGLSRLSSRSRKNAGSLTCDSVFLDHKEKTGRRVTAPLPGFLEESRRQKETRKPNSIQRLPCVRLAGINSELITPKFAGLLMFVAGSKKFTWLKMLKKSAEISTLNRS